MNKLRSIDEAHLGDLVRKSQKGDLDSFEDLVAMHYAYGKKICVSRFNSDLVDDILQEAFIKVWKNIKKLNDPNKFKPWFRSILITSGIDLIRKESSNSISIDSKVEERNSELAMDSIMSINALKHFRKEEYRLELREFVEREISRLREPDLSILRGYYMEGKSISELAKDHQMSIENIKTRSHRAKKTLRKMIHLPSLSVV